ncbi:hypothetical protein ZIOFF_044581 [Zingiber officinale]|uniref:RING-CH-type domain-containing protein n=1 Tax=Zingiber officinale TaxID=94328 RepID=A0A8J5FZC9_ZINOF|nr:hypothetical protein ZIOFF_044581 [Zingiber officinale]
MHGLVALTSGDLRLLRNSSSSRHHLIVYPDLRPTDAVGAEMRVSFDLPSTCASYCSASVVDGEVVDRQLTGDYMTEFASRMEDHLVLYVDRLMLLGKNGTMPADEENSAADEGDQLLQMAECRICQEEGLSKDFEIPCACSGSLKYAHRTCVQHWCNEKGDITCEICNELAVHASEFILMVYSNTHLDTLHCQVLNVQLMPGKSLIYTKINFSGGLTISGSHLDLHDPWFLATTAAHRHSLETEYDEYDSAEVSGPVLCRSVVLMVSLNESQGSIMYLLNLSVKFFIAFCLISEYTSKFWCKLLTLLLLRQAFSISVVVEFDDGDDDDDVSTYFSIFLLRAIVFLLPCYIMAWAISILQRRWRRKEAAALAANEAALILQQSAL